MNDFLITIITGFFFGSLFLRLAVPGGMIVGSIIGVSLLNILTGTAMMPHQAKLIAQIIAGAYIGVTVETDSLKRFRRIRGIAIVILVGMLIQNLVSGILIYRFSSLDLITSLMSAVPGGMSNIPIISAEMGADVSKVAVMQFVRLLAGIGLFPVIISFISNEPQLGDHSSSMAQDDANSSKQTIKSFLFTIVIAFVTGLIGDFSGIPAGALLFSLIGTSLLKITNFKAWLPKWTKRLAQVLSGAYVGSSVLINDVFEIRFLIVPIVILVTGYMISSLFIGWLIHKKYDMSLKESLLSATPAGASDMALIASDLGIKGTDVIVLHVVRMLIVVTLFPHVMNGIVKLFESMN